MPIKTSVEELRRYRIKVDELEMEALHDSLDVFLKWLNRTLDEAPIPES